MFLRSLVLATNTEMEKRQEHQIKRQQSKQRLLMMRRECQEIFYMMTTNAESFDVNRSLATHLFLEKEFLKLKSNILMTQIQSPVPTNKKEELTLTLGHLLEIMSQLIGKEETSVSVKLHLLDDPSHFLVSRLLDPHCLGYAWPFGGVYFTFSIMREDDDDEVKNDQIFIEDATLHGAGLDSAELCLVESVASARLWRIRGAPIDNRDMQESPDLVDVPVFSSNHPGELFKVPIKVGKQSKQFWERKNLHIKLG